jgi:hypothetical protein
MFIEIKEYVSSCGVVNFIRMNFYTRECVEPKRSSRQRYNIGFSFTGQEVFRGCKLTRLIG